MKIKQRKNVVVKQRSIVVAQRKWPKRKSCNSLGEKREKKLVDYLYTKAKKGGYQLRGGPIGLFCFLTETDKIPFYLFLRLRLRRKSLARLETEIKTFTQEF